ncbi:MAG: TonB-dependent receptor [Thermomonas sp.]|uniref:TonB-dependent receptor domain-containing protein n=1 Tax=Thermomonas sp. TaxID=1971895 RepID=UPI0039E6C409
MNLLCVAVLAAIAVPAMAQQADAPSNDTPSKEVTTTLDKVSVTGSRIKRTELEEALPITIIQKQEIEAQGITSAEQLLQFLNIAGNSSDTLAGTAGLGSGEFRASNGVSGANLRGQGADATLVLLNGRRVATHGLRGQAVDLNSIPFAAIERVEVLRDGASAMYGTDAIGGVINFITRTDYRGITVNAGFDVTQEGGGNIYNMGVLGGIGDLDEDRWNAWGTVNWKRNEILRGIDRDFTNTFQPERGLSPDTSGSPFATVITAAGSMMSANLIDPAGGGSQSRINVLNLPGAAGCESGGEMMGPYGYQIWGNAGLKYSCAWDYARSQVIQQPLDSLQALGRVTFKIGDNHRAYAEAMVSEVESKREFEYQQMTSSTSATAVLNPTTWYPLNDYTRETYDQIYNALVDYFGPTSLVYGNRIAYRWRCYVCGQRQQVTTTKASRFVVGLEGDIGKWTYDTGITRGQSEATTLLGDGYYYNTGLQAALGSGYINPFLMPGQEQAPEAIALLEAASAAGVQLFGGKSVVTSFDANFSGGLGFNLWGGEVQLATGIDIRREEFEFGAAKDANGNILTGSVIYQIGETGIDVPKAARTVKALYAEAWLPVHDTFELTLAVRRDEYDTFGGTTNPKYSFKWQPIESLAFRGAYSTGFKVPEFTKLFTPATDDDYTGFDLADPSTCPGGVANSAIAGCEAIKPQIRTGGKTDLRPETSKQRSLGVVFAPVSNFNVSLDWWEIERIDTIRIPDLNMLKANYDLFVENFIRDSSGEIVVIDRRFVNSGGTLMSGVELDTSLTGELAGGSWRINLNGSYIDSFREKTLANQPYSDNKVGEYVRYYNLPLKWKHTLSFGYSKGDWAHLLTQVYRHGYKDELPPSVANGTYIPSQWNPDVDRYITYNYSLSWTGLEKAKFTLAVRNLLNTDPPFTAHQADFASGAAWEPRVADPRGRSLSLSVEYNFN